MKHLLKKVGLKLLFIPPVIIGLLVLASARNRGIRKKDNFSQVHPFVRTVEVKRVDVLPRVLAYGTVKPSRVWVGTAQVSGRISYKNPLLKVGQYLQQDTLLVKIDPSLYELKIKQLKSNRKSLVAQKQELIIRQKSDRKTLAVENSILEIKKKEFNRMSSLSKTGASSGALKDQAKNALNLQKTRVLTLENLLALFPAKQMVLTTKIESLDSSIEEAQLYLAYTEIRLPFNAIISKVNCEINQFIPIGFQILTADCTDGSEIVISPGDIRQLIGNRDSKPLKDLYTIGHDLGSVLGVNKALVRLSTLKTGPVWEGKLIRPDDKVNLKTGNPGLVIEVKDSFGLAVPGVRPPLFKGAHCQVELQGTVRRGALIIPRSALFNKAVYVVDKRNRLHRTPVTISFYQSDFAVVDSGLNAGDRVISVAVDFIATGMVVNPLPHKALEQAILRSARGEGSVR